RSPRLTFSVLVCGFFVYWLRAYNPLSLFFFTAPSPTEIYTLSLHDALPISRGHHVGTGVEDPPGDRWRHPEAARGVLDVHHAEVDRVLPAELREELRDRGTARVAVDVPDHQDVHRALLRHFDAAGLTDAAHLDVPGVRHLRLVALGDVRGELERCGR